MNELFTNVWQGWQCPICKRVYSPFTKMCPYCGGNETKTNIYPNTSNGDFRDNVTQFKDK